MTSDSSIHGAEGSAQERTPLRSVFGVTLGLLLLLVSISTLMTFGAKTLEAAPALATRYKLGSLPFGLKLRDQVFLLPGGERVFVFDDGSEPQLEPQDVSEVLEEGATEPSKEKGKELPAEDWATVEALLENGPPAQVFLVEYPDGLANKAIERQFHKVEWKELKHISGDGGRTAIDGGKLDWDGYAADFVLERQFRPGLKFTDRLRVNMTVEGECWVAYCIWPDQTAGSKEPVEALLNALQLVSE